jgi:hypothetical protein
MSIYTVYKITNIVNNKIYIGYTSKSITNRLWRHIYDAKKRLTKNVLLHKAIRKHGEESFIIESLYCSLDKQHTHKVMEPFFIAEYKSHCKWGHGYNATSGGDGVPDLADESRASLGAYQLKTRQFVSPNGVVYTVDRLSQFCKENNLCRTRMADVWDGKQQSSKGWRAYPLRPVVQVNKGYHRTIRRVWHSFCTNCSKRPVIFHWKKDRKDHRINVMTPQGLVLGVDAAAKLMGISRVTLFTRIRKKVPGYYRLY